MFRFYLFLALFFCLNSPIFAQNQELRIFSTVDDSFHFEYTTNASARIEHLYEGSVSLFVRLEGIRYEFSIMFPWYTRILAQDANNLRAATRNFQNRLRGNYDSVETTIQGQPARQLSNNEQFWLVFEPQDQWFTIIGTYTNGNLGTEARSLLYQIAESYDFTYPMITNYDAAWEDVISEMQADNLIGMEGHLLYESDNNLEIQDVSYLYDERLSETQHFNFVISGVLEAEEGAYCGFFVPQIDFSTAYTAFGRLIGISGEERGHNIIFLDPFYDFSRDFELPSNAYSDDEEHRFLALIKENYLSIYIDGTPFYENILINRIRGHVSLYFYPTSSSCSFREIWVYEHDTTLPEDTCMAQLVEDADACFSHMTCDNYSVSLSEGKRHPVVDSTINLENEIYYLLDIGLWIAAEDVETTGNCRF